MRKRLKWVVLRSRMPKIATVALLAVKCAVVGVSPAVAQTSPAPVTLLASELHEFRTNDGTPYDVSVAFPPDYEADGDATYPVVYVTDAFYSFSWIVQTARAMDLIGELPPMILVGVENPVRSYPDWAAERALILTPTRVIGQEETRSRQSGQVVRTGGADAFLAALTDEIIPWVEARYPVSSERGLFGDSLGGLFVTHALLRSPRSFTHYWIGSPSLYWDNEVIFAREEAYASEHTDLSARVFMLRMSEALLSRNYAGLVLERQIFNDETHMSVIGPAITRALVVLFGTR
jgi:hypothetical protein